MEGAVVPPPPPRRREIKKQRATTTGKTISYLPDHTICDIVSRLPLKSIVRCKRVCKTWRNLILDPYFAKLHRSRSPLSLIFYSPNRTPMPSHFGVLELDDPDHLHRRNAIMKFRIEFHIPDNLIEIIGSCNGAICLSDYRCTSTIGDNLIVCNPIRAQFFILPDPPKIKALVFISAFGFGYSPSTDLYKVVRFTETFSPSGFDCDIYTLGNGDDAWRRIGGSGPLPVCPRSIIFLNGALHWRGRGHCNPKLCYFDIEKEQCGNFSLPSHIAGRSWGIGVVDNYLYIADYHPSPSVANIWVMKDYGDIGSFTLQWAIEQPLHGSVRPVKTLKDGTLLIFRDMKSLATYNPETRVLQGVKYCDDGCWGESVAVEPSFLSPSWML